MWSDEEEEDYGARRFKAPPPTYTHDKYSQSTPSSRSFSSSYYQEKDKVKAFKRPNSVIIPMEEEENESGRETDYFDSENEDEEDEEGNERKNGNLDKWDRASRIWLSSGTVFLLILLFHLIQVRNDIRLFISDTSIKINQECNDMEHKFINLGSAIEAASNDVGPISMKFVRDMKLKIRNTFQYAAQIFGGKIREVIALFTKQYYCIFIGAVIAIYSFLSRGVGILKAFISDNFMQNILDGIQRFLTGLTGILLHPEEEVLNIFESLQGMAFDGLRVVEIPVAKLGGAAFCEDAKKINFVEINYVLRNYMKLIIVGMAIILILYNSYKYLAFLEDSDQIEKKIVIEIKKARGEDTGDQNIFVQLFYCWIPLASIRRLIKWFCQFMSYQPFWIFLSMGLLGMLHLHFSKSLHDKTDSLKKHVIEPVLNLLDKKFTETMDANLKIIEKSWIDTFNELIKPIAGFISVLGSILTPIFTVLRGISKTIEDSVKWVLKTLYSHSYTSDIGRGLHAMFDCFFLRQLSACITIGDEIKKFMTAKDPFKSIRGGIIGIIKNMIGKLLGNLEILKNITAMLTISIKQFLDLLNKRSSLLYIYLILCLILIFQGLLMALIKFLLGYF